MEPRGPLERGAEPSDAKHPAQPRPDGIRRAGPGPGSPCGRDWLFDCNMQYMSGPVRRAVGNVFSIFTAPVSVRHSRGLKVSKTGARVAIFPGFSGW